MSYRPLITAGLVLGIGLGGFIDGILFHQILQTHNMLSNIITPDTVTNIEINMFWDGLFHAFTLIMTMIGLGILWQVIKNNEVPKIGSIFLGGIFIGAGLFNVVEGVINHTLLQLHHVIQRTTLIVQMYSDLAFLISGFVLMIIGSILIYKSPKRIKN